MMVGDGTSAAVVGRDAARDLLVELVSIPSPSGEEAACADRVHSFFEEHGREVWRDEMGNVRAPGDDAVLLTSHLDTVPGSPPVRVEDGKLWGRGSVDAKGSLAAMAVAAVLTGVSFAGVVREETDSAGAAHLITDRPQPDAVINGEPSGWQGITLGYRGSMRGTYTATTPAGHAAGPDPNAIEDALGWYEALVADVVADDAVGFNSYSLTPVSIEGGPTDGWTGVEASITVDGRIPPGGSAEAIRSASTVGDGGRVEWERPIPPVVADARSRVANALRASIREVGGVPRLLHKTGTADMNRYADAWEVPIASYGPGDSALDHTADEHLRLAAFDDAVSVLQSTAIRLGSGDTA